MDEGAAHDGGVGPAYSLLRHPTITSSLSLPLPHHTILFGDSAESRSDDLYDDSSSNSDGRSNNRSLGISIPVMLLDLIWNLAFIVVSVVVLIYAAGEKPSTPLRIWVLGYSLQCLLHVGFVYFQYRMSRRNEMDHHDDQSSTIKRLESINTMISSIWWVLGFYWIVVGGQALLQDSPRLYWLTVVCLAFDMFFILFCIGMACIIFFVVFCCIPILAVAYAVAMKKGACEDDIKSLPKYRYCQDNRLRPLGDDKNQESPRAKLGSISSNKLPLLPEDSDCCICLSRYIDGVELYVLPCRHHFHCGCISKWLRINATCPLCKFSIRNGDTLA